MDREVRPVMKINELVRASIPKGSWTKEKGLDLDYENSEEYKNDKSKMMTGKILGSNELTRGGVNAVK